MEHHVIADNQDLARLTMPEALSVERRTLPKALGAQLVLTPAYERKVC